MEKARRHSRRSRIRMNERMNECAKRLGCPFLLLCAHPFLGRPPTNLVLAPLEPASRGWIASALEAHLPPCGLCWPPVWTCGRVDGGALSLSEACRLTGRGHCCGGGSVMVDRPGLILDAPFLLALAPARRLGGSCSQSNAQLSLFERSVDRSLQYLIQGPHRSMEKGRTPSPVTSAFA